MVPGRAKRVCPSLHAFAEEVRPAQIAEPLFRVRTGTDPMSTADGARIGALVVDPVEGASPDRKHPRSLRSSSIER